VGEHLENLDWFLFTQESLRPKEIQGLNEEDREVDESECCVCRKDIALPDPEDELPNEEEEEGSDDPSDEGETSALEKATPDVYICIPLWEGLEGLHALKQRNNFFHFQ